MQLLPPHPAPFLAIGVLLTKQACSQTGQPLLAWTFAKYNQKPNFQELKVKGCLCT